jgi:hypothetical protein
MTVSSRRTSCSNFRISVSTVRRSSRGGDGICLRHGDGVTEVARDIGGLENVPGQRIASMGAVRALEQAKGPREPL